MSVEKICERCEDSFTTDSIKHAASIFLCDKCYQQGKRSSAEREMASKWQHSVMSIEDRLTSLENQISMIPMLIGAEINSVLLSGGLDVESLIQSSLKETANKLELDQIFIQKRFEKKLQKQIVTLNNKIVKLMKEMEE
tara:strand:+ start:699 stop:1115 length:417 start_codon:yes stop_codon:yes gene_type:complete